MKENILTLPDKHVLQEVAPETSPQLPNLFLRKVLRSPSL